MRADRLRTLVRTAAGAVGGVLAVAALAGVTLTGATAAAATTSPVAAPVVDVALDQGDLGKFLALRHCATSAFAADPDAVRVLYGRRQLQSPTAASRVFVLRNGDGKVLLCDMFGRDRPAILPLPTTSAERPAVFFTNGQRRWSCDGATLRSFRMTTWLKVERPVASARVRYVRDGVAGPWFTSARQSRFVHLQSWLRDAAATEQLQVELQVLDGAGDPIAVRGLPRGPRPLDGCGGGTLIG